MSPRSVTATAKVTRSACHRCGLQVLDAITETGQVVRLDAEAMTTRGELEAVLARVATYTHHLTPDQVGRRYPLAIRGRPAGTVPRQSVHRAHTCGRTWRAAPAPLPPGITRAPGPDDAPPY